MRRGVSAALFWRRALVLAYRLANRLLHGTGVATLPPVRALDSLVRRWMRPRVAEVLGHQMYLDRLDSLRLGVFGIHEPTETHWIQEHVPRGGVAVDVGANIGYHVLLLARQVGPSGHVYAFEPDPDNFALLERNVVMNGYRNVTLEQAAVSSTQAMVRLYRSTTNLGDHRVYESNDRRQFVQVPAVVLDQYFSDYSGEIDYIKLDIQGSEAAAVAGMRGLLERYPAMAISSEFWPEGLARAGSDPAAYLAQLMAGGRRVLEIDENAGRIVATSADKLLRSYGVGNAGVTTVLSLPAQVEVSAAHPVLQR